MLRGIGIAVAFSAALALPACTQAPPPATPVVAVVPPPPPAPPAPPAPIDAAALRSLYAAPHREDGTVLRGAHVGAQWTKWTKPDGSLALLAGHGLFADTGKFVVRGNMVCSTWGHIDAGRENCMQLVRVGADEYVSYGPDGHEGSRFRVVPQVAGSTQP